LAATAQHFMVYAPKEQGEARDYGVARYGMEVQRLLDVLDKHLEVYIASPGISFDWHQS
jgi:GST-like protein